MLTDHQKDRIKGVFYGQAIGDALGLGTEFMTKDQVAEYYPKGLSHYDQIIRDRHRSRWPVGAWTDDTDQFLCIVRSIIKKKEVCELAFAEELYQWFQGNPMGIGKTVYKVVSMPQFTLYPHKAAQLVWKLSGKNNASNGAVMRTSVLGTFDLHDADKTPEHTEKIAKVTHWDARCTGSCAIVSLIIRHLLLEDETLPVEHLLQIAEPYHEEVREAIAKAEKNNLSGLSLGDAENLGYTIKALSAGLWAYYHAGSFEEGITKIIMEGGDADTNASVAGSILGARFGFSALPGYLIEGLTHKTLLEDILQEYLMVLETRAHYCLNR